MVRTGPVVTLEVAKQGAIYHGLATLLQQPSPVIQRGKKSFALKEFPTTTDINMIYNTRSLIKVNKLVRRSQKFLSLIVDFAEHHNFVKYFKICLLNFLRTRFKILV